MAKPHLPIALMAGIDGTYSMFPQVRLSTSTQCQQQTSLSDNHVCAEMLDFDGKDVRFNTHSDKLYCATGQ